MENSVWSVFAAGSRHFQHSLRFCRRKAGGVRAAAYIIVSLLGSQFRHLYLEFSDSKIFPRGNNAFKYRGLSDCCCGCKDVQIRAERRNFSPQD